MTPIRWLVLVALSFGSGGCGSHDHPPMTTERSAASTRSVGSGASAYRREAADPARGPDDLAEGEVPRPPRSFPHEGHRP